MDIQLIWMVTVMCLGLFIFICAFCLAIKSSDVAVPGHFLLQARTGTCYTHHQAIVVQSVHEMDCQREESAPVPEDGSDPEGYGRGAQPSPSASTSRHQSTDSTCNPSSLANGATAVL
ncbi:hypothetical protein Q8A67_017216 [Cirrhinus molitorella]|uniref:Uncharacterized protein n=1 Tax=Cirrhinus molitorella TaxID=172907 RepID=A0AA88PFV9_9TELE|nr:hypothetical protein Q8A67_017216 [Cirrhinus molitorella]